MIVMIMAVTKLSSSYAVTIINNHTNTGPSQDKIKQIVDNNAFSDLSRNVTSSTKGGGHRSLALQILLALKAQPLAQAIRLIILGVVGSSSSNNCSLWIFC
jgi:hypothetical protein